MRNGEELCKELEDTPHMKTKSAEGVRERCECVTFICSRQQTADSRNQTADRRQQTEDSRHETVYMRQEKAEADS